MSLSESDIGATKHENRMKVLIVGNSSRGRLGAED